MIQVGLSIELNINRLKKGAENPRPDFSPNYGKKPLFMA
jgi:hypothetical protein